MADSSTGKLIKPLSYIDWVQTANLGSSSETDLFVQYSEYARAFYKNLNNEVPANKQLISDIYKDLLKDIVINYTTVDERRILGNINYDDPTELDIIVPYFARKLKHITQYLVSKRQDIQFTKIKNSFKGSKKGIEAVIVDKIYSLLSDSDFIEKYPNSTIPSISAAVETLNVDVDTLYDTYQHYFDIDTSLDKDNYTQSSGSGHHYSKFGSNVQSTNTLAFLDIESAIQKLLEELPQILVTDCTDDISSNLNLDLILNIPRSDISELPYNYFINATKTLDNLILQYDKVGSHKYAGTSMYYLSTGSTTTDYVSGTLYEAKNSSANLLNRYFPSMASVPNTDNLATLKDLGGFFTPAKLGILNYAAPVFTYKLDDSNLSPNTLYVFPDPDIYAAGRGNTRVDQKSPFKHTDDVSAIKNDIGNDIARGDIVNTINVQKMWPYQSRQETLHLHTTGISRSVDNLEYWTGTKKDVWGNPDIYPLLSQQPVPTQNKLDDLLVSDNTLYQWKTDIYGNEYALYKAVHPARQTTEQQAGAYTTAATQSTDTTLDTGLTGLFHKQGTKFYDYQTTAFTTQYDSASPSITTETSIYDKQDVFGNWYMRNSVSTVIDPVSSSLSGVFIKYNQHTDIKSELNYKVRNFDIVKDVLIVETENFIVIEKVKYDHSTSIFTSGLSQRVFVSLSGSNRDFENFSNIWYNDTDNKIYLAKLSLHPYLSGSNYKILYPQIFEYNMNTSKLRDVYSLSTILSSVSEDETSYIALSSEGYSLSGSNNHINIVSADRPTISHNRPDKKLTISYTGLDPANKVYTTVGYFNTNNRATFTADKSLLFKPVNVVTNYHVHNFSSTSLSVSSNIVGPLHRSNINEIYRISVDGLTSEIDFGGTPKSVIYGPSTYPSLSGRPILPVTAYIDSSTNTSLLGHGRWIQFDTALGTHSQVANSQVLPYTHNSSYLLHNLGLDPTLQDIEAYIDVAFYTLTLGNSAYTHTLNTSESAFEGVATKYGGDRAPGGGMSIFFFDTAYEFYPAGIGSALGYTNYTGPLGTNYAFTGDINGIRGGYVGIGFDIEGNFGNTTNSKTGTVILTAGLQGQTHPYTGIIKTCNIDAVSPNTLTLRSSELSSYNVLTTTVNLSDYPIVGNERYVSSPSTTLHQYVSSRDDITFHKMKVCLQNAGKRVNVEILNSADGKFYPYLVYDLNSVPPTSLRVGVSFATSDYFTNCEVKNFSVYGNSITFSKNRDASYFEPLSSLAFTVSGIAC
jgi:hypothetical protein